MVAGDGILCRYDTFRDLGMTPEGNYWLYEIDHSGKGDRITEFTLSGKIENEVILM